MHLYALCIAIAVILVCPVGCDGSRSARNSDGPHGPIASCSQGQQMVWREFEGANVEDVLQTLAEADYDWGEMSPGGFGLRQIYIRKPNADVVFVLADRNDVVIAGPSIVGPMTWPPMDNRVFHAQPQPIVSVRPNVPDSQRWSSRLAADSWTGLPVDRLQVLLQPGLEDSGVGPTDDQGNGQCYFLMKTGEVVHATVDAHALLLREPRVYERTTWPFRDSGDTFRTPPSPVPVE